MTNKQINLDDLKEVVMDMEGIEALLVHLESSEYFKGGNETEVSEDSLTFRAIRNSLEHTKEKLVSIIGEQ